MNWFHGNPSDCPSRHMVADLTLTGGGNYEPTGTQHAECSGHCQHVWLWVRRTETTGASVVCRDCREVR